MSESLFASLPRFDQPVCHSLSGIGATPEAAGIAEQEVAAPAMPVEPETTAPILDPNVEQLLKQLSFEVGRANEQVMAQTSAWVLAISERLFPELSKAFLAEEIGLQLPRLLPDSANQVVITAPDPIATEIEAIIQDVPDMASRCSIKEAPEASGQQVEVSWITGGLTIEFNELLQACLDRLKSIQMHHKESE